VGLQQPQDLQDILSFPRARGRSPIRVQATRCVLVCWLLACAPSVCGDTAVPYRVLKDAGADFLGPGRELPDPQGLRSVRLGVIGPSGRWGGKSLRLGIALAVAEANARGGYKGIPFEVVFRPDDGPWGMGAKQVVALAYEDSVWVVLGSLEGGDAHLAELVAAKLWVPVITPVASDHTIDYANVPWVFRVFPSDVLQARLLAGFLSDGGHTRMVAWVEDDREGRTGLRRLDKAAQDAGVVFVGRTFKAHVPEASLVAPVWRSDDVMAVWARPEGGLAMVEALRKHGYAGPILLPSCVLSRQLLERADRLQNLVVAAPYHLDRQDTTYAVFAARYEAANGVTPDPVAAFSYDTACLTIAAIRKAGLNRARIRDALAGTRFPGVAGIHSFDRLGGTGLEPVLLVRQSGAWLPAGRH